MQSSATVSSMMRKELLPRHQGFPGGSVVKNLPAMQEMRVQSLSQEDPLWKGMASHSSIFAWEIPWTEEHGRLESMGLQKAGHNLVTEQQQQLKLLRINI